MSVVGGLVDFFFFSCGCIRLQEVGVMQFANWVYNLNSPKT